MGLSSKQVSADNLYWPQGGIEFSTSEEKQSAPLLKCPRCESTNTKFCYYNNYSRSQPRHFCRTCRRHWTDGGSLRNIPVGGGRKNKRRKIAPTSPAGNPAMPLIEEAESPIFPDILQHVLLHAPLPESWAGDAMHELFGTLPTFMEDFNSILSGGNFSFTLSAGDSPDVAGGGNEEDVILGTMGTTSAGIKKEAVVPTSCWDFWDGAVDFNNDVVQPFTDIDNIIHGAAAGAENLSPPIFAAGRLPI